MCQNADSLLVAKQSKPCLLSPTGVVKGQAQTSSSWICPCLTPQLLRLRSRSTFLSGLKCFLYLPAIQHHLPKHAQSQHAFFGQESSRQSAVCPQFICQKVTLQDSDETDQTKLVWKSNSDHFLTNDQLSWIINSLRLLQSTSSIYHK